MIQNMDSNCQIVLGKLLSRNLLRFIDVAVAVSDEDLQIFGHSSSQDEFQQLISLQDVISVEYKSQQQRAILHLKQKEIEFRFSPSALQFMHDLLRIKVPQSEFLRFYHKIKTLKSLRNGEIVECLSKSDSMTYVAKIQKNSSFVGREIEINKIMARHPHINVMTMIEYFQKEQETTLILPYLSGGTLNHFISTISEKSQSIYDMQVKIIMKQILKGLEHIHQLGFIHRDIKMDNIMIVEEGSLQIKIIDFGLSILKSEVDDSTERCGTIGYLAPEIIHTEHYTENCDIYSLAQVFHILLTGNPMYDRNLEKTQILMLTVRNRLKIDKLSIHSDKAIDLLQHMIKPKGERYSVKQCLDHEYFREEKLSEKISHLQNLQFHSPFEKKI